MKCLRGFSMLLVLAMAILACDMSTVLPTPTPDRCAQSGEYADEVLSILVRWQQTFQVASSTARIALATPIMELQRIRNDFAAVQAPSHLVDQHSKLLVAMDLSIEGFLYFQSHSGIGAEAGAAVFFEEAERVMDEATGLLDEAMAECGLATPYPVFTTAPTHTAQAAYLLTPTPTLTTSSPTPTKTPPPPRTPTPTWTPRPTPTFTPIPLGSRGKPVSAGQPFTMPNDWRVTVLSFDPDAWPEVQAENQYNDPPLPGQHMVMIRLRVEYVGEEYEPSAMHEALFTLTGSSGIVFTTFGRLSSCGVIPDPLIYVEGYRGSTDEGNICFQIPNEESDLKLVCDVVSAQYHFMGKAYFRVQ